MRLAASIVVVGLALVGALSSAQAQQQRIFVSATGSDTNPCSFPQPCRSFQHAHDVAPNNAEIDVLDPAGYGALTITKSISIQGHGFSGITVVTQGITINSAGISVNLRGLLVDGGGPGANHGFAGIYILSNAVVNVQDCLIRSMFFGIAVVGAPGGSLFVSNTLISDNVNGISLAPSGSGTYTASLHRIDVDNNETGIIADGSANSFTGFMAVTVADSMVAKSSTAGISATAAGPTVNVLVTNSSVVDGGTGLTAGNSYAIIRLNQSTIAHNVTGYTIANGGAVTSYHNNVFDDNFNNGDTPPPVLDVE